MSHHQTPAEQLCKSLLLVAMLVTLTSVSISVSANGDLAEAAEARTAHEIRYDGSYRAIAYPLGDVPDDVGVCSDVVIRAYRTIEIDLQQAVHEDMRDAFDSYPQLWGLSGPDPNIDHRRVPNLERFFERHGEALTPSRAAAGYRPGDIVTWRLSGKLPHIGIVSHYQVPGTDRYAIVHNIGEGPKREDVLFAYPLHGHYRYPTDD